MFKNPFSNLVLIIPSFVGLLIFFIVPFFYSFYYAFIDNAFSRNFVGISNFIDLFNNDYFMLALRNTLVFTFCAVILIMALSITISVAVAQLFRRLTLIESAFFLPFLLPSATIISIWNAYFSNFSPFSSLVCLFLWKYCGLNIVLLITALSHLNFDMFEAARIDGAGAIRRTFYITLPNIMPNIFFTLLISIANAFKISRESFLLYGDYPDRSIYMLQNYLNNHFEKLNYQNISTAAIILSIIIYTIIGLIFFFERKWGDKIW